MIEFTDHLFLLIPLLAVLHLRTANAAAVALPTVTTYVYAYWTNAWDAHSGVVNHCLVALAFLPGAYFTSSRLAFFLTLYCVMHWFYALDYHLRPESPETVFSSVYSYLAVALNFSLIAAMFERNYNNDQPNRRFVSNTAGLVNLWHYQTYLQAGKK